MKAGADPGADDHFSHGGRRHVSDQQREYVLSGQLFMNRCRALFTGIPSSPWRRLRPRPAWTGSRTIVDAHRSRLGIDDYRNYAILDGQGRFLDGSNPNLTLMRTSNVISAMAGGVGTRSSVSDSMMDIAVPVDMDENGSVDYIVYIVDDKQEISDLSWRFFQIRHAGDRDVRPAGGDPAVLPAVQDHHHPDRAHHRGRAVDRGGQLRSGAGRAVLG